MNSLSSTTLNRIEAAARRYAQFFEGFATPATIGIDVQLGTSGSIRGVAIGAGGALYELDALDASTIAEAMVDAAGVARSGPRAWRRIG